MIDPAAMPIVLGQVSEVVGFSDGLTKGGMAFVAAVLAFIVWAFYREIREAQAKYLALVEKYSAEREALINKHNSEILSLLKESMPLTHKLAEGVGALERLTNNLTRAD